MTKRNSDGGYDDTTHHLIALHEPPDSLVALRKELANHPDITDAAQHGADFEECIAIIATKLDIALDGTYDVGPLCEVLVEAMRNRGKFVASPHLRAAGLVDVELIEREGEVEIVKRDRDVVTLPPEGSIVTESDSMKKETAPTIFQGDAEVMFGKAKPKLITE